MNNNNITKFVFGVVGNLGVDCREHPLTRKDRNLERSDVDMGKNKSFLKRLLCFRAAGSGCWTGSYLVMMIMMNHDPPPSLTPIYMIGVCTRISKSKVVHHKSHSLF